MHDRTADAARWCWGNASQKSVPLAKSSIAQQTQPLRPRLSSVAARSLLAKPCEWR